MSRDVWGFTEVELWGRLVAYLEEYGLEVRRQEVDEFEVRPSRWRRPRQWPVEAAVAVLHDRSTGRFSVLDRGPSRIH